MSAKENSRKLLPASLYELTDEDKKRFDEERALGMTGPADQLLNKAAKTVDPKMVRAAWVKSIVERLLKASSGRQYISRADKPARTLVGLAAPQIGEPWRIVIVDTKVSLDRKNGGRPECFINPEIIWRTRETEESREGCFSTGPVWGIVRRPVAIKIKAFTPEGKKIERVFEGFAARIMQHEIDHLNGIRFPERIRTDKKRHWVHAEEIYLYPENMHKWPRLCTRERWESLKQGKI
jgi:peptide deformylase